MPGSASGRPRPREIAGSIQRPIRVTSAPSLFYAQARVFADYLIERSGKPRIFTVVS